MNSVALLLLWTLAAIGQISAGATPQGVKAGWKPETDGSMSYIAQVTPQIAEQMATQGQEMALDIPDFLQGRVNRIVWRIGLADVEREPSEAELRSLPPRQIFPKSGENPFAHGGLSTLSDQTTGNTVLIDSPRPGSVMLPTAGVGRASDNDPTLPPVPSLAQSFTSPSARASQANQLDMYRSGAGSNNGGSFSNSGVAPVLPRTDTFPSNSKPVFGPPPPPTSGYTGGQVTVTGTPTGTGNTNAWNDNRLGSSMGQNGANAPLANGNFGNPNNYGPTGSSGVFSAPNPSYATTNPQGYPATSSTPNGGYTYPNSSTQNNAVVQPNYANANTSPDALFASNNFNYGANPYSNGGPPQLYPQASPATQPWNNPYAANGTNYTGMMPNQGVMSPPVPYIANNPQLSTIPTRPMVDGTRRTMDSRDNLAYENIPATPPSYVVALLLASLVGNAYLVMLLNQLLQRYRALQASSRGSTSLAI